MKRTKKIKPVRIPDAILTSDWHLREDTPVCRVDKNFEDAQWEKVQHVARLQDKFKCPVLHAGDLFHHWKPSPRLLTLCIKYLPNDFCTVYGNHDLPQHNMELNEKCGVTTLAAAERIIVLPHGHWNHLSEEPSIVMGRRKIAVWHVMTYAGKPPWPGCTAEPSNDLLRRYPGFDLIVTGDNHQTFVAKDGNRLLVNPGNLTRQTADDSPPVIFFYYADDNTVEEYELPYDEDAVSRVHLERKEERDERIGAFIERLNTGWEGSLDFVANLRQFEQTNKIKRPVMEIVYKAVEEIK